MEYKTIEKSIVRESKVRNVFSKVCKKELFYTNLKVNTSSEELLKSSKSLFAYPSSIGGGSCLAISQLNAYGKAPDTPFCIKGHTDPISCFEFSPFNDHVIATGSRDCTIKLWEIPEEGLQSNLVTPLITLPKQNKRITGTYFHPSVDSLFLSTTLDYSIDLWDLSRASGGDDQCQITTKLTGSEDIIMSLSWNTWSGGNMLASSSRDKKMRIYDPRTSTTPIATIPTHEGAQGFKLTWADSNGLDLLCTVGASKSAQRQLFLWDPRQLSATSPLSSTNVTTDSSILTPFYDYATNILFLGGKGDGIYYYELERSQAHLLGKASFGNVTQSSISLLPKSICEPNLCEIDRFLRLTNNSVEMVSFIVPRKSTLFQEDIFPAAPSGDPTTDCQLWFSGGEKFKVVPHTKSMKPEGATSIYDVSEEEGGKSKQKDKLVQLASTQLNTKESFLLESEIKQEIEGWLFNTYESRYLKLIKDKLYCFLNEDSAQAVWELSLLSIKNLAVYDDQDGEWALRFNILLSNDKDYKMECRSTEQRDAWITSINAHIELKKSEELKDSEVSPTLSDFQLLSNTSTPPNQPSPASIQGESTIRPGSSLATFSIPTTPIQSNTNSPLPPRHSVLARNPSYTSLKLSSGMSNPNQQQLSSSPNQSSSPISSSPLSGSSGIPRSLSSSSLSISSTTSTSSTSSIKQSEIIIEGSLFELVPGLIWNSNIEKWFVVSSSMLYSFKTKQLKNEQPLETYHLEKALSVHKTKDIFVKIQGFSFQLSTPNRIIHLLAKTKEERQSWLSVIKQNLKTSGESKPTPIGKSPTLEELNNDTTPLDDDENNTNQGGLEEEEEDLIEGQIQRKLPGIFSMWGSSYLSLLAEDLFLAKSKLSVTPELRIQLQSISLIKKTSPTEFTLYDGSNNVVCNFRTLPPTEELDDCSRWVECLEAARKRSIDIIKMFGINEKEVLGSSSSTNFAEDIDSDSSKFLDLNSLKAGKQKVLIQIKGKRKIRVRLVKLSASSLNTHNAFVLDAGPRIFVWIGAKSSRVNRAKAIDFANRIRTKERGGKSTLIQLDENKSDDSPDFWLILGGDKPSKVAQSPTPEEQDAESIKTNIYRIGLDIKKNTLRARLGWEGTDWRLPNKELLNTKFVYVVDCQTEIFVWIGKESSSSQRKMAIKVATVLQEQPDRQDWTRITRVLEFGENNLFKEKFANFPGMLPISTTKQENKNYIASAKAEHPLPLLVSKMEKEYQDTEVIFTDINNEGSKLKIWKIEDFEKIDHPSHLYSQFFGGDSYIVLYTYMLNNKEAHVIYYYLGRDSSINEKGTSAYLTVNLHESLTGSCVQTRVVQNKEAANFLNLFKKKMIVHKGKFNNYDSNKPALYQVKGKNEIDVRAVQVDLNISHLNTNHVYILRTSVNQFIIWHGINSPKLEQTIAIDLVNNFSTESNQSITTVQEGSESNEFLNLLGISNTNNGGYYNDKLFSMEKCIKSYHPRLFVCTNSSGIHEVNEESPFSQDDLDIGSIYILDVFSQIYIWLGNRASHKTKKTSMEVVLEFVKTSKLGHSPNTTEILVVEPFAEPISFKSHFRAWDTSKYPKNKLPVQEKQPIPVKDVLKDYLKEIYTYEELLADPLPNGIDSTKLETYLPDDEFEKIFQMTRKEWEKIPVWKREGIKKSVFLF
ncbi:hypothetical protein CYY_009459 [Polysphondylium violaceum]|uniref:Villin n=1 Tax=Polysphondylium violaceum TaxID=133409 RepID=A0A8J4UW17_9MYCE|nr:hypothetical protein CYY_009459 [Polysphondylium violaceum]